MRKDWQEVFISRFCRYENELQWLYYELYHGDIRAYEYFTETLYRLWEERPEKLKMTDRAREAFPDWYNGHDLVGMLIYVNAFVGNLKDLNVAAYPALTDLAPLIEGVPNLERFWCGMSDGIPQEQKEAMEAAHPDCEFNWTDHPTGGTWRRHWRYPILHHMFLAREYAPFIQEEESGE